jgi:nucleoside 2-deoxyribosyltransferase
MRVYLAHPYLEKPLGVTYTAFLESHGFDVINPFRDVEQGKAIYHIMRTELSMIENIDVVVVLITDAVTRAVHMEAFYANAVGKPVIVVWLASDKNFSWYPAFARIVSDSNDLLDVLTILREVTP